MPRLLYTSGTPDSLYVHFTHEQLDSVVTKTYFGSNMVTSKEAYEYNDGTLLFKKTETSGDSKIRKTENTYIHDVVGLAVADSMKKRNMRGQVAQISVKDNSNNGYSSAITTWRIVTHSSKNKFLPDKEFRWRNSSTAAAILSFNWGAPAEGNGWILTQTFDQYDQHGNLTQVKDANGVATTISWDVATATLIDSIKTRPTSTLKPLTTKYTYDANTFRLTAITDPNNQKTEYKYDPLQRLIEMITPDKRTAAQHSYLYSRQAPGSNDNFVTTNPNHVRSLASTHAEHVRNSDFENGSGTVPTSWIVTGAGSGVGTWDNTTAYSGVRSLKADMPTPSAISYVLWKATFDEKVSSKEIYRIEMWAKTANGYNGNAKFILYFHDSGHASTETKTITIPAGDRDWTKYTMDFISLTTTDHLY
ncbi:MAG: carbohydrate binding domain-containing protein, partial [bacterium]